MDNSELASESAPERVSQTVLKSPQDALLEVADAAAQQGSTKAPLRAVPAPPLRVPPPPSASDHSAARAKPSSLAMASVRLGANGSVVASQGNIDLLSQLVAYVGRLTALLSQELSLDAFSALHAELVGLRVVIFQDAGELVGLMLEPGQQVQALRQQLGV